ncbi:MAG: hypothetical protein AAF800_03155 [Planctomycetota bacterium]
MTHRLRLAAWGLSALAVSASAEFVWWEGESPSRSTFPASSWFSPDPDDPAAWSALSGGDWLTSTGPAGPEPPAAGYDLQIPAAGRYHLWVRQFWRHGRFHWRFADEPWRTVPPDAALTDRHRLPKNAEASWTYLGEVELDAGPTTFDLRLAVEPGRDTVSGFDCFVLSRGPFVPRGKLKPEAPGPDAEPGWVVLDPQPDLIASLDLRGLNEDAAGQHGPLRLSADGNDFVRGDGEPARFWGVNVSSQESGQPDDLHNAIAARLASLGVNLVRHHSPVWRDGGDYSVDAFRLERLHHLVATLKAEGIYTNLSLFFPLWVGDASTIGLSGYGKKNSGGRPFAAIFFNPTFQAWYRDYLRQVLTAPNPHTGLTLAEDPAVGFVELVNEDSLFFWTFNEDAVPPAQWAILERRFGAHLTEKYGSLAAALRRWPRAKHDRDDASAGTAGVFGIWHMTSEAVEDMSPDQRKRIAEQVEFLAGLQRDFYAETHAFLRDELGFRGLVIASNWHAADNRLLDAVERWTYAAADVIDHHGYFNAPHDGEAASYSVRVGQTFNHRPAVRFPTKPPLRVPQVVGRPSMISELGWTGPNRRHADATLLTAAALSVQGVDAAAWFIWNAPGAYDAATPKFALATPMLAGTFPATALAYRRGDLGPAPAAVHEALRTDELFNLEGTAVATEAALDDFRRADIPPGAVSRRDVTRFDPLTAYVGPVTRSYDTPGDRDRVVNLSRAIDRDAGTLTSLGGGFRWDFRRGVAVIDTPRTQAAAGFLRDAGPVRLGDVTFVCDNEHAHVAVTSLDGEPIASSRRLLIQAVSEAKLHGEADVPNPSDERHPRRLTAVGSPPWQIRPIAAAVTLHRADGDRTVELPADRLYTVVAD